MLKSMINPVMTGRKNIFIIALVLVASIFITSCDRKNGELFTGVELPLDFTLPLYCEDEGVHPENCILENPENPYVGANISMETVWDFNDECPSPKAKFYLWGTMLANIPIGEYRYHTAQALHELYTAGGSQNAKAQAKKAYRAALDYFFDNVTWWHAHWLPEETYYAVAVKDLVGAALYDPSELGLLPLYSDPAEALADLSEWGYIWDFENNVMSKWE